MKTFILSIWSMATFSAYFACNKTPWQAIPLLNLLIVYTTIGFAIGFKLHQDMVQIEKSTQIAGPDRTSLMLWTCIWGFVIVLFALRDLGFIMDIGMISALWLFFVLVTTVMTSCYVIIQDSNRWTVQLFSTSVLHWVLSHGNKVWLDGHQWMLGLPVLSIIICRIAHHVERNKDPRQAVTELIVWICCFAFELSYDLNLVGAAYYIVYYFFCYLVMAMWISRKVLCVFAMSYLLIPLFIFYSFWKIKTTGFSLGMSQVWLKIDNWWNKGELHDPSINADEIGDDML